MMSWRVLCLEISGPLKKFQRVSRRIMNCQKYAVARNADRLKDVPTELPRTHHKIRQISHRIPISQILLHLSTLGLTLTTYRSCERDIERSVSKEIFLLVPGQKIRNIISTAFDRTNKTTTSTMTKFPFTTQLLLLALMAPVTAFGSVATTPSSPLVGFQHKQQQRHNHRATVARAMAPCSSSSSPFLRTFGTRPTSLKSAASPRSTAMGTRMKMCASISRNGVGRDAKL